MKRAGFLSVILVIAASGVQAATFTWEGAAADNAAWTNGASWVGGTAPDNAGGHDIVLTNGSGAARSSFLYEDWTLNSLTFSGSATHYLQQSGNRAIFLGAGGHTNVSGSWLYWYPKWTFTTADSHLVGRGIPYNTLDSTFSGGTRVHLQLTDLRVQTGFTTTTNVFYYLESGGPSLYGAGINNLGLNKLFVTLADPAVSPANVRSIGWFSTTSSNHLYFDTPIEFDAATMAPTSNRRFDLSTQKTQSGGSPLTVHVRGNWTMTNGPKITNVNGLGWLWLNGGGSAGNVANLRTYYEQDSSTIVSDSRPDGDWAGDVFVYSGIHVIHAPHAFKTNNSAFFNIGTAGGGTTTISNNMLLATSGNHVAGIIALRGGDSINGTSRPTGTIGIEGTGSVEFTGNLSLGRWAAADTLKVMNLALYAGPGGTANFSGNIKDFTHTGSGDLAAGLVDVVGGGTVILGGFNTYTNRTTVRENTTLQLDGSMVSEIEVLAGSTLKGVGASSANVILRGDFAPGASIGTFTAYADVDFLGGSTLTIELGPGNTSDLLDAYADLDITGATLRLVGSDVGTFTIANYGSLTGTFSSVDTTGLAAGLLLDTSVYATGINYGGKGDNTISLTVIPEPASFLLLASGLVAAWKLRRRA